MRRHDRWALLGMLLVLATGGTPGTSGHDAGGLDPTKEREIPLASVFVTFSQQGVGHVMRRQEREPYVADLDRLYGKRLGPSNLFLVRAQDIAGTVKATHRAFREDVPVDIPISAESTGKGAPLWLTIYLGATGSEPSAYHVHSVKWKPNTVRVNFSRRSASSADVHQYFAWIPLGRLDGDLFTLELFDAEKKEVILMRRVRVGNKGRTGNR